jgi:hypothetical protein
MRTILEEGIPVSKNHPDYVYTFDEFTNLVGLPEIQEIEKKYSNENCAI